MRKGYEAMIAKNMALAERWEDANKDLSDTDDTSALLGSANQQSTRRTHPMTSRGSSHSSDSSSQSLKNWGEAVGEPTHGHVEFKPEFHPDYPRLLKLGTRGRDRTAVWITFFKGGNKASRCLNAELELISRHKLAFKWHPQLELDLFEGVLKRDKETSRRDYLCALIEEHLSKETGAVSNVPTVLRLFPALGPKSSKDTYKDPSDTDDTTPSGSTSQRTIRRTRTVASGSGDKSPRPVLGSLQPKPALKRALLEPNADLSDGTEPRSSEKPRLEIPVPGGQPVQTVLRVTTSNNPARAPVNVLFAGCGDVDALFHKVLVEGGIAESLSTDIGELTATLTRSGRRHLIRRGNASDWGFFYKDLQGVWTREAGRFVDADCEVDILVHDNF